MKTDRLNTDPDGAIIRLYAFTPAEAEHLRAAVQSLAAGLVPTIDLVRQLNVQPIADFSLILAAGRHDAGLNVANRQPTWTLRPSTWDNVEGLIEPFTTAAGATGYQWLSSVGDASLLLSVDGAW